MSTKTTQYDRPSNNGGTRPSRVLQQSARDSSSAKPSPEAKTYATAKHQLFWATCSLSVAEMETALPLFHACLLVEGRTKGGTEAVLPQALQSTNDSNNPGLIYLLPELVQDIMGCKYGLNWDTSYRNCHCGLSP